MSSRDSFYIICNSIVAPILATSHDENPDVTDEQGTVNDPKGDSRMSAQVQCNVYLAVMPITKIYKEIVCMLKHRMRVICFWPISKRPVSNSVLIDEIDAFWRG